MTIAPTKLMTADELLATPDHGAHRYELVQGELIAMSPAGAEHGDISLAIGASLRAFVTARKLGKAYGAETGFVLGRDPDTVRSPDAAFVSAERVVKTSKYFPGPPDLAVEVISPTDLFTDVDDKVREYLRAGVRMVIVVNPRNETATVHSPNAATHLAIDDALSGGDVVPGWSLPLRELFS
jgi:Uma2 family endonuclease